MAHVRSLRLMVALAIGICYLGLVTSATRSASLVDRLTSSGLVTSAVWSPDGQALYYTRSDRVLPLSATSAVTIHDLYRVSFPDGDSTLIARNANSPALSSDGRRAAYVSFLANGGAQLNALDLVTRAVVPIAQVDPATDPAWGGTGGRLLYSSSGSEQSSASDGSDLRIVSSTLIPSDAVTSPSGDQLVYAAADGLHRVEHGLDLLIYPTSSGAVVGNGPRYSHDGARIGFVVTREGVYPELVTIDRDGQDARVLASGALEYFSGLDWSPDDTTLVFVRTPSGSEISGSSDIWRVNEVAGQAVPVTRNSVEESSPRFSPDGRSLAFLRDGDLYVLSLDSATLPLVDAMPSSMTQLLPSPVIPAAPSAPTAQLVPPSTIRVRHDATYNSCRSLPDGAITVLDFETYVKRVVPRESPASWEPEELKTQAVAARSYAWYYVLYNAANAFDVYDSTRSQYMCDTQDPRTDAAVDATRGQYGDYGGSVIFAAYGANNGDPTRNSGWNTTYLIAVDDPVGFKDTVSGNGIGMSQWGAQRWALPPYNWNYQQILTHYYTGITVESPAGSQPDTRAPIGGMVDPRSNWGVTSNQVWLKSNASDDSSGVASVEFNATYFDGTANQNVILPSVRTGAYWTYLADLSTVPDQTGIAVSARIRDGNGNQFDGNGLRFTLDRILPTGTVNGPPTTSTRTVTLNLNGSDAGSSGLVSMAISNNWVWEGENQSVQANSGTIVNDPAALNGKSLKGQVGVNPAGAWYGPYATGLAMAQPYRAYFRLKTDNNTTTDEVALLDVVDNGGANLFGVKRIRGIDFAAPNAYQEFYVDFYPTGSMTAGLEFRVAYRARATLWLDRILIVSYPVPYTSSLQWTLPAGDGLKTVLAKFIDGAGNISADAVTQITLGAGPTPTATGTRTPTRTPTISPTPSQTPTATSTPVLFPAIWLPAIVK